MQSAGGIMAQKKRSMQSKNPIMQSAHRIMEFSCAIIRFLHKKGRFHREKPPLSPLEYRMVFFLPSFSNLQKFPDVCKGQFGAFPRKNLTNEGPDKANCAPLLPRKQGIHTRLREARLSTAPKVLADYPVLSRPCQKGTISRREMLRPGLCMPTLWVSGLTAAYFSLLRWS